MNKPMYPPVPKSRHLTTTDSMKDVLWKIRQSNHKVYNPAISSEISDFIDKELANNQQMSFDKALKFVAELTTMIDKDKS